MPSKLYSVELHGMEGVLVEIEVDKLGGIPTFTIVGLPDAAVKEACERVRSAIKNSGFLYPRSKIVVNLAPADLRKMGPRYDLPIALGILAMEDLIDPRNFRDTAITGELALDGKVRPINGILSSVDLARKTGFRRMIVPAENAKEAALIKGIEILPAGTLKEAALHMQDKLCALPIPAPAESAQQLKFDVDMASIRGQQQAKRALEIAAAGGHNLLLCGPPGAGKTLLARALAGILPGMSDEEKLEVTKLYSVAGLLPKTQPLITHRPFRSIHHTASAVSIVGGGDTPRPGEISLAHRGILFMDEIAEFPSYTLDVLRQPMENKWITVSRAKGSFTYPAQFTLVAAMNPCPCGYYKANSNKSCTCTNHQIKLYQKRLSGPLLDRIDMRLDIKEVEHNDLIHGSRGESSEAVRRRIQRAAHIQHERFAREGICKNAEMENRHVEKFCKLDSESQNLLNGSVQTMSMSARAYFRTIKLARTIADLKGFSNIKSSNISEAINLRNKIF